MSGNLVSVLIPAYNHEKYILETIDSIIKQTYQNIELVIIDDGSKDKTWDLIQSKKDECIKRFIKFTCKTRENKGTCDTFNELISLSSGKYIYIIASDDMVKSDAILKFVDFLDNNNEYVVCLGDSEIIDSNSKRVSWDDKQQIVEFGKKHNTFWSFYKNNISHVKNIDYDNFVDYTRLIKGNYVPNGYLIRKECFNKFCFTKEAPLEDFYLHLQLVKFGKYKFIDEVLFSYRWHDNNTIKNVDIMKKYFFDTISYEYFIIKDNIELFNVYKKYAPLDKVKIFDLIFIKLYKYYNILKIKYYIKIFGIKFLIFNKEL